MNENSKYVRVGPSALRDYSKNGDISGLTTQEIALGKFGLWSDYIKQSGALDYSVLGEPVTIGIAGEPYDGFEVYAINGTEPYEYALVGNWPEGISIDSETGVISGTIDLLEANKFFPGLSVSVRDFNENYAFLAPFTMEVQGEPAAPENTTEPSFTGTTTVFQTLYGNKGVWTGVPVPTFAYQWQISVDDENWTDIDGATSLNYTIQGGDYGKVVRLHVTATNSEGSDSATSSSSAEIVGLGPVNVSIPSFTGTSQVGQTLYGAAGSWNGVPVPSLSYQWQVSSNGTTGWTDIDGATSINYTIQSADYFKFIRLVETATNAYGTDSEQSSASDRISGLAPENTDIPFFTGTPQFQSYLYGNAGTWIGVPSPTFSYQWQVSDDGLDGWSNISGATSINIELLSPQYQKYVRLEVTGTNVSNSAIAYSTASSQVAAKPIEFGDNPYASGTAKIGSTITSDFGTFGGWPSFTPTYQWEVSDDGEDDWTEISGATSSSFEITTSEYDKFLRCAVTVSGPVNSDTANSNVLGPVAGLIPVNTAIPEISGNTVVSQTLTASSGSWTGYPSITYEYQWERSWNGSTDWADISGANTNTRIIQIADNTQYLRIRVTATNDAGSNSAISVATSQITADSSDDLLFDSAPLTFNDDVLIFTAA